MSSGLPLNNASKPATFLVLLVPDCGRAGQAELQLDGCVNGNLEVHQLTIGEKGVVKGNINADTLIILGKVEGDIHAKEVTLQPSAKVYGNIEHETLTIAAGAHIDGKLTHIHEESNVTAIASSDKQ